MVVNRLKKSLLGMKSLKESLFSDNITTDIPVDFNFIVNYVQDKINKVRKKGINVDMYKNNRGDYEVTFISNKIRDAKNLMEWMCISFVIAHPNNDVGVKPYTVFGVDRSFILYINNSEKKLYEIKGITFDSVWSDQPDKLIKTIDGFFEGFEKINKDKQPIITGPRQTIVNNIGLALFYNKMKRCFNYLDLKKID